MSGRRRTATAFVLATLGYNALLNRVLPEPSHVPANLATAGLLVLGVRRSGVSWDQLGLDPRRVPAGVAWGATVAVPAAAAIALAAANGATRRFFADERVAGAPPGRAAYELFVRIPLATALAEELIFRSALPAAMPVGWSRRRAALASAALFGCWHVLPTLETLRTSRVGETVGERQGGRAGAVAGVVVATFLAGLKFSWLRHRSGSVVAPVLAHVAINASAYAVARRTPR